MALGALRWRLSRGEVPLDTRLAASEIAAELGLSATPVREALSRLAGEGLLDDRRGEGFFVRRLTRADVATLFRLSLAHLAMAVEASSDEGVVEEAQHALTAEADPVEVTERAFGKWTATGGRALGFSFARLQAQLGATRRLEPRLMPDLVSEARALFLPGDDRPQRLRRLKLFYGRRVRLAGRLAELLAEGPDRDTL
jgi:DNA-binding transcriptional regulator YhcF (GntR family)